MMTFLCQSYAFLCKPYSLREDSKRCSEGLKYCNYEFTSFQSETFDIEKIKVSQFHIPTAWTKTC